VTDVGDRRRRWLKLHAGAYLLLSGLATAVWWLAEGSQGLGTPFWPGWIMVLLLLPLALHAALVYATGPSRQPPAQPPERPARTPTPASQAGPAERALATVVFTDIVGSTQQASQVGDRRWSALLDTHDRLARELVDQLQGRLVKSTGDGILATFDRPGRGIRFVTGLRDRLREAGLDIRAGVHTGEVVFRGEDVGGIAVHIAARVMAAAGPGEVLVSGTVHDLVAGSDYVLQDRGAHTLKGMTGEWRLYSVTA
jgi:class 3 adenylate cyclase